MNIEIFLIWCHLLGITLAWPHFVFYPKATKLRFNLQVNHKLSNMSTGFDPNQESYFLIHGFNSNAENFRMQVIKKELSKYTNGNIFIVDWYDGCRAQLFLEMFYYPQACRNTYHVGRRLASFISTNKIDPAKVTCIGYSLGAHACGFAGKYFKGKLGRISAIDPAGPLFKFQPRANRLAWTDAEKVDCIYTTWFIGIESPICKQNFYFNLDFNQPQCFFFDLICSHLQGVFYYANTIKDTPGCHFRASRCASATAYRFNQCPCTPPNNCIQAGFHADKYAQYHGTFYLTTKTNSPYCKH